MPSPADIASIIKNIGDAYDIKFENINDDDIAKNKLASDIQQDDSEVSDDDPRKIYDDGSSYTFDSFTGFVPNLETFSIGDIAPDPNLYPRRIEQNLDEALRLSQMCLQLRQSYMELARLRNDTKFKLEEFFRLDKVHKREVTAGVYKLPWQEAQDDVVALTDASAQTLAQQKIVEDMINNNGSGPGYSGILSSGSVTGYITAAAQLAQDSASFNQPEIHGGTTQTITYRAGFDAATWYTALASAKASAAQLKGRLDTAKRKNIYLKKDEIFRTHRAAISKYLAILQASEFARKTSAINYNERLIQQGDLFRANLKCLIERVFALRDGLHDSYNIKIDLKDPARGKILDKVSIWLVDVQNAVTKYRRQQRSLVRSVWSDAISVSGKGGPNGSLDMLQTRFVVDSTSIPSQTSLLRGVSFEYLGQQQQPISLSVLPPAGAYVAAVRSDGQPDTLQFGRIFAVTASLDLKPQHSDVLWNGSAMGEWQIAGLFNQSAGSIDHIIMHLWLAEL
ncbi:hypothetical protein [Rhizobium sp. BR 362]|uniref:hypothetical protein n=1 Tax=Rhizobium sp. BR 362 TaxID=3040670 RepID=UPI002F40217C